MDIAVAIDEKGEQGQIYADFDFDSFTGITRFVRQEKPNMTQTWSVSWFSALATPINSNPDSLLSSTKRKHHGILRMMTTRTAKMATSLATKIPIHQLQSRSMSPTLSSVRPSHNHPHAGWPGAFVSVARRQEQEKHSSKPTNIQLS